MWHDLLWQCPTQIHMPDYPCGALPLSSRGATRQRLPPLRQRHPMSLMRSRPAPNILTAGQLCSGRTAVRSLASGHSRLAAEAATGDSCSAESGEASDGEQWQGGERQGHTEEVESGAEQSSPGSPRSALDENESAQNEPDDIRIPPAKLCACKIMQRPARSQTAARSQLDMAGEAFDVVSVCK